MLKVSIRYDLNYSFKYSSLIEIKYSIYLKTPKFEYIDKIKLKDLYDRNISTFKNPGVFVNSLIYVFFEINSGSMIR